MAQGIQVAILILLPIKVITSTFFFLFLFFFGQLIGSPGLLKFQNLSNSNENREYISMVTPPTINFGLQRQLPLTFSNMPMPLTFSFLTEENVFPYLFFLY